MQRVRIFQFNEVIDNNFLSSKGSIVVPTNVKKVVGICPTLQNGVGILSIYNEKTNEELCNQLMIADDNQNWDAKNYQILNFPECNNLKYILRLLQTDIRKSCILKISISYTD